MANVRHLGRSNVSCVCVRENICDVRENDEIKGFYSAQILPECMTSAFEPIKTGLACDDRTCKMTSREKMVTF